ncbi:MAG: FAD-binding protein [Actinomycetia bacterium]|nr:FAD-binding protein [Actinomycetes bacterium]
MAQAQDKTVGPVTTRPLRPRLRAIVARFAKVACPPGILADEMADALLAEFGTLLCALPTGTRVALTGGLVAFDQGARLYPGSRGRRFTRLPAAKADAYFRAALARGGGIGSAVHSFKSLIVFCYYELPQVKDQLGYRPDDYMASVARRRLTTYGAQLPAHPTAMTGITSGANVTADLRIDCDVVIVGSGAGGATMAAELADAGVNVVIVEEGGYHQTESFSAQTGRALRTLYRDGGVGLAMGSPPVLFSEGRCVGGSTVVNGGMSWRTPERVLDRWADEEGITAIRASDMEAHFAKAEARISVALQDPETIGRDSQLLKAGADALGWRIIPNRRNQLHCAGSNNCTNGCPTGAKQSMLLTSIPRALGHGARLFADCRAERITWSGGRATGVEARFTRPGGQRGPRLTVAAKVVVAAGGAVQTPALLMRSGIRHARLGRDLTLHPNAKVVAFFDEEVLGWQGVHQAYQVREFIDDGILMTAVNLAPALMAMGLPGYGAGLGAMMAGYNHMVTAGCLIEDTGSGRVRNVPGLGPQVTYQLTDADAERVVRGTGYIAELMLAAGARRVLLPFAGAPEIRDVAGLTAIVDRPVARSGMELFTVHLMGTARMSADPGRGVTDSFGACHGMPNLLVADASLLPGPIGVNPMETIISLVMRNAQHLLEQRERYGI